MKKITLLLFSLCMLTTTASATITKTPLPITGVKNLTGEVDVSLTDGSYAEFYLTLANLDITKYPKMRIQYSDYTGNIYFYASNSAGTQELDSLKKDGEYESTITFDTVKFKSNPIIKTVSLKASPSAHIHIKDVVYISTDGTEVRPIYHQCGWSTTIKGIYSGVATMGEWVRMGGTAWAAPEYNSGEIHQYTLQLNTPVKANQFTIEYRKSGDTKNGYMDLPDNTSVFSFFLNFKCDFVQLMHKWGTQTIDIASMTRTVFHPEVTGTTDIYDDNVEADMGNWSKRVIIPSEKFEEAYINDIISVSLSNSTTTSVIGFRENTDQMLALDNAVGQLAISDTTTVFNYVISTDSVLKKLRTNGLIISGNAFTLKNVELKTTTDSYDPDNVPAAVKSIASNADNGKIVETKIYNVAGQLESSMKKGH